MNELITRLLAADPTADVCGGDVVVYKDGVHVSYGRTVATGDGLGGTVGGFQLTEAGQALLDSAPVVGEDDVVSVSTRRRRPAAPDATT